MILVTGALSDLGSRITRRLLAKHAHVRILVRPQANFEWLANLSAQPVYGNASYPPSLEGAFRDVTTVISAATATVRAEDDALHPIDFKDNQHIIDAAKAAGVKQFIFISALGASPHYPSPFFALEGKTEEYLKLTGMPYTILQPGIFMETWINLAIMRPISAGLPVTIIGDGKRLHAWISEYDVALFAVGMVNNPIAINQTFALGGPEPLRWRDVLESYEHVTGHKLQVRYLEPGKHVGGVPDEVGSIMTYLALTDTPCTGTDLARIFGIQLTPVVQVIREIVGMGVV